MSPYRVLAPAAPARRRPLTLGGVLLACLLLGVSVGFSLFLAWQQ